jgi:hypothetical protein
MPCARFFALVVVLCTAGLAPSSKAEEGKEEPRQSVLVPDERERVYASYGSLVSVRDGFRDYDFKNQKLVHVFGKNSKQNIEAVGLFVARYDSSRKPEVIEIKLQFKGNIPYGVWQYYMTLEKGKDPDFVGVSRLFDYQ